MEKVDKKGEIIGFSILKVSALEDEKPISGILRPGFSKKSVASS